MRYKLVIENGKSSRGLRRHFKISTAEGATPEAVEQILLARAAAGQAFLPGTLIGENFEGEAAPLYNSELSNNEILEILSQQFRGEASLSFPTTGYKVTCGLKEGYGESGTLHTVESIVPLIPAGATTRTGVVCYAWPGGVTWSAGCGSEPQAIIEGEGLDERELNELAATLGAATGQSRVYVALGDQTWILQAEDTETPTGETV